jgi:hypothetical protein
LQFDLGGRRPNYKTESSRRLRGNASIYSPGLLERRPIDLGGGYPGVTSIWHQLFCITANATLSVMVKTAVFRETQNSGWELMPCSPTEAEGVGLLWYMIEPRQLTLQ